MAVCPCADNIHSALANRDNRGIAAVNALPYGVEHLYQAPVLGSHIIGHFLQNVPKYDR